MNISNIYNLLYAMSRVDILALLDDLKNDGGEPLNDNLLVMSSAIGWNRGDLIRVSQFVLAKKL